MTGPQSSDQQVLDNLIDNAQILSTINDGVYIVDHMRRIIFWNKAAEEITGYSADEVIGKYCQNNILNHVNEHGCQLCNHGCPLVSVMHEGRKREVDVYLHHRKGYRLPVHVRGNPVHGASGKVIACVEIFNLSTPKITMLERLNKEENQALMDTASSLPNHVYLRKMLGYKLPKVQLSHQPFGIIALVVNRYAQLLSTWGDAAVDRMIHILALSLSANSKVFDTAGRLAEDQFLVITNSKDADQLLNHAQVLKNILSRCTCQINQDTIELSVSMACTMALADDTDETLLARISAGVQQNQDLKTNAA